jgi:molecular chaperone DnaK (HSP70)
MRLGIDFGTTRVVVATADRGNYPIVTFETPSGEGCEWYPSLLALRGEELCGGHEAEAVLGDPAWQPLRAVKRHLGTAGPQDLLLGWRVPDLAARFLGTLRDGQAAAVEALSPYDCGVLAATTAFGKTVVAADLKQTAG